MANASVIIAGLISTTGGSAQILQLIESKKLLGLVNITVLTEVENNLIRKIPDLLPYFRKLILNQFFNIVPDKVVIPSDQLIELIPKKTDLIILRTAQEHNCTLLTLDKKHLLKEDIQNRSNTEICTPGEFLQRYNLSRS